MLARSIVRRWPIGIAAVAAVGTFAATSGHWGRTPGEAQLVAFESLASSGANETCEWEVAGPQLSPSYAAYAAPAAGGMQLPPANARMDVAKRQPLTFIQDPYPSFSSIARGS